MNNEEVLRLIESYKTKEVLWNPTHLNYYNRTLKQDAWDELAREFHRPVPEIKKKIEYLQSGLRREKQKMEKTKTTGQGADAVYKSSWFAYSHMMFLLDKNKPREGISTEDDTHDLENLQDTPSSPTRTDTESPTFATPPVPKKKKKTSTKDPIVLEALELMRSSAAAAAAATATTSSSASDSRQIYANYLASKFRTYSQRTFTTVEHKINNILYCADSGQFEWESRSPDFNVESIPVSPLSQPNENSQLNVENSQLNVENSQLNVENSQLNVKNSHSSVDDQSVTEALSQFITFANIDENYE